MYFLYVASSKPMKGGAILVYFTDKKTEAQRGEAHTDSKCQKWGLNLDSLAPVDAFFNPNEVHVM